MDVNVMGNSLIINPGKPLDGISVGQLLVHHMFLPEGYVKQLFREQRVKQGRELLSADAQVKFGHRIALERGVEPSSEGACGSDGMLMRSLTSEKVPDLDVLYEDEHLLIVNKPAPLLVHPGTEADTDTLDGRVAGYYRQNGFLRQVYHVHRLDRETTGTILYAKHAYSARALDSFLTERLLHRRYLALVRGALHPHTGVINRPIGRDRHHSGRYLVSSTGKPAVTKYKTLGTCEVANDTVTLVECELESGRTHQIRVHMSSLGCPVIGDRLYGGGNGVGVIRFENGHALHAYRLFLPHPYTGQQITVSAPIPYSFHQALHSLGLLQHEYMAKE